MPSLVVTSVQIATDSMGNFVARFKDAEGNDLTDNLEEVLNSLDTEMQNKLASGASFDQLPATLRARICHALEFRLATAGSKEGPDDAARSTPTHAVPTRAENRQLNTQSSLAELLQEVVTDEWRTDSNGNRNNSHEANDDDDDDEADGWRRRQRGGSQVMFEIMKPGPCMKYMGFGNLNLASDSSQNLNAFACAVPEPNPFIAVAELIDV